MISGSDIDAADIDWKATAERMQREIAELAVMLDAAHGIICNAHRKRVDDVTTDDGASPGWAEAARHWIDSYPPASLLTEPTGGVR